MEELSKLEIMLQRAIDQLNSVLRMLKLPIPKEDDEKKAG